MPSPPEAWPARERDQGRSSTAVVVVVASAFSAMTIAYGLALFHPPLVRVIESAWSSWSTNPAWAITIVALGSIVAAGSLALIALARLTRGMQRAPFTWAAPLLVVVSALALLQLQAHAIAGLSAPIVVAGTMLLTLAGGALLRIRRLGARFCAALLLAVPAISLLLHHAAAPGGLTAAWATATTPDLLFGLVLLATPVSMTLLSLATLSTAGGLGDAESTQAWRERLRHGEHKLAQAKRRAKLAERTIETFDRPAAGRLQPFLIATVLLLVAVLAGAYFSVHQPLLERARHQQTMLRDSAAERRVALDAARQQWASERTSLEALLAREQSRTTSLVAEDRALRGAANPPATTNSATGRSSKAAKLQARTTRSRPPQPQNAVSSP